MLSKRKRRERRKSIKISCQNCYTWKYCDFKSNHQIQIHIRFRIQDLRKVFNVDSQICVYTTKPKFSGYYTNQEKITSCGNFFGIKFLLQPSWDSLYIFLTNTSLFATNQRPYGKEIIFFPMISYNKVTLENVALINRLFEGNPRSRSWSRK